MTLTLVFCGRNSNKKKLVITPPSSLTPLTASPLPTQIAHLGDDDEEPEFSSIMPLEEGDTFFYGPRALLNLVLVDELDSLSPIMAGQIADLGGSALGRDHA